MGATKLSESEATSLHDVVIDYLVNQAYAGTARILSYTSNRPKSKVELDETVSGSGTSGSHGDRIEPVNYKDEPSSQLDEEALNAIEQRSAILNYILSGAILRAIDALNTHFPRVLASTERGDGASIPSASSSHNHTPTNGDPSSQAFSTSSLSLSSSFTSSHLGPSTGTTISGSASSAGILAGGAHSLRRSAANWAPSSAPSLGLNFGSGSGSSSRFGATVVGNNSSSHGLGLSGSGIGSSLGSGSSVSIGNGNVTSNGNSISSITGIGGAIGNVVNGSSSSTNMVPDHTIPMFINSSEPDHVRLNLQIQQFIEMFRQLGPSSPSSSASSISSIPPGSLNGSGTGGYSNGVAGSTGASGSGSGNASMPLTSTLTALQNLHAEAKKLSPEDRAVYLVEIKDVGALLAYTDPETSILRGFLQQDRRMALARQVNAAILRSHGRHVQSHLELCARRVSAIYSVLADHGVDLQLPPTGPPGAPDSRLISELRRNDLRGGFNLREYAAQTWS